jgi:hypothetical protein
MGKIDGPYATTYGLTQLSRVHEDLCDVARLFESVAFSTEHTEVLHRQLRLVRQAVEMVQPALAGRPQS